MFVDVFLFSRETENVEFDITETQESKIAEETLSNSTTPLHEPTTIQVPFQLQRTSTASNFLS